MRYTYWVIRHVPSPVRGEYVNIGLIVGASGHDWAIQHVESFARANRIGGEASRAAGFLDRLASRVEDTLLPPAMQLRNDNQPLTEAWLESLRPHLQNTVQLSHPRPISAGSADDALRIIYPLLIEEAAPVLRPNRRTNVVRAVRRYYADLPELHKGTNFLTDVRVRVGRQRGQFDNALGQVSPELLTHAWSFQLEKIEPVEERIGAWNFLLSRMRDSDSGGLILETRDGSVRTLDHDVRVQVVHDTPTGPEQREALERAREAWNLLHIDVVVDTERETIVDDALEAVGAR